MMRILGSVTIAALLCAAPVTAAPVFTLVPSDGIVVAEPGGPVGWGYEIVNDDPLNWLVISNVSAGVFEHGTITDPLAIFDFPIVAAGSSLLREYVTGVQGLYEFTWDADAPAGFVNSGVFIVSAELWDNDPVTGGQFFAALPDFVLPYEVRVPVPPPTTVPESSTLLLFSSGIVIAGWSRRRRLV
jgi:hypothetical protein